MNKTLIAILASFLTLGATASLTAAPSCCPPPADREQAAKAASPNRLILASYEKVSNALASDDLASAQAAARTLAAVTDITGTKLACAKSAADCGKKDCDSKKDCDKDAKGCADTKGCTKSLQALIEAKDLKVARAHFKGLSAQAIALAAAEEGFYVMSCPMAGENANWLQSDRSIRNPYHGQEMLQCGIVKN